MHEEFEIINYPSKKNSNNNLSILEKGYNDQVHIHIDKNYTDPYNINDIEIMLNKLSLTNPTELYCYLSLFILLIVFLIITLLK